MALRAADIDAEETHGHLVGQSVKVTDALLEESGGPLAGCVITTRQHHVAKHPIPRAIFRQGILQVLAQAVILTGVEQP